MLIRYIFKRILFFIPTLFIVSLAVFMLDKYMPDDPVLRGMNDEDAISEGIYLERWKSFNLDNPNFYFSFTASYQPDTLYKIPQKYKKKLLQNLVAETCNWEATETYFQAIENMDFDHYQQSDAILGRTISSLINLTWTEEQANERAEKMAATLKSVLS